MFPYDQIPVSKIRTSLDIERFGMQSLLRALNIGRVVAFVGSGTSIKFGQPSWGDFKKEAKRYFHEINACVDAMRKCRGSSAISDFIREYNETLLELSEEIKEHEESENIQIIHFVGLCEKYFEEVCLLLHKSIEIRQEIKSKRIIFPFESLESFRACFAEQFSSVDPESIDRNVPREEHELRVSEKLSEKYAVLPKALKTVKLEKIIRGFDELISTESLDISREVFKKLGVVRFLTLNYDLEIERMLLEETRSPPEKPFSIFKEFVDYSGTNAYQSIEIFKKKGLEPGQAVELLSASGRVVRSTSSKPETLADLFAFGAFPTNYDASVHHLHGRVDDPDNMIITPHDYQKIYYGKSEQIKSFDEARHAVFTGSDLLVFGMGYSETDVLKPLRDLLEFEASKLDAYGKVYYLTTSKLDGHSTFSKAFEDTKRINKALSQELFQTYSMHALFADFSFQSVSAKDGAWDKYLSSLFFLRAELAYYKRCFKENRRKIDIWTGDQEKEYEESYGRAWGGLLSENDKFYLQIKKIYVARELAHEILKEYKTNKHAKEIIDFIDAQMVNIALASYAQKLSELRGEWWSKWSDIPGMRLAVYGSHCYKKIGGVGTKHQILLVEKHSEQIEKELVWKQTNLICFYDKPTISLGEEKETPQFTSFMNSTVLALEETKATLSSDSGCCNPPKNPAVVVRVCMPGGTGKGRLVSFFTNKQTIKAPNGIESEPMQSGNQAEAESEKCVDFPFRRLFNAHQRGINYIGIFSIELTFALEFSSLVVGVGRYLQNILPNIRGASVNPDDKNWDVFLDHIYHRPERIEPAIEHLRKLFRFLQKVCPHEGWRTRVIIMLSDLDKVVDEFGDAYSPVHRSFFRLISGWHDIEQHSRLPIDFILIASKSEQPIRYLSVEQRFSETEHRLDEKWRYGRWVIRKDRQCALRVWYEIEQLKPDRLAGEALLYAVLCKKSALYSKSMHHSLTAEAEDIRQAERVREKIIKAINPLDKKLELSECLPQGLRYFLRRRAIHAFIISALAVEIWFLAEQQYKMENKVNPDQDDIKVVGSEEVVKSNIFIRKWHTYSRSLSAAYTKNRAVGYFEELFRIYANIYQLRENIDCFCSGDFDQAFKWRKKESELCIALERLRAVIVDHMALFAHPVSIKVLAACPEVKIAVHRCLQYKKVRHHDEPIGDILSEMADCGLAARYWKYSKLRTYKAFGDFEETNESDDTFMLANSVNDCVFTLDPEIISVVREKNGLSKHNATYIIPHQSSLYTSQLEHSVKPEMHHFRRVSEIVRALLQSSHQKLIEYYDDPSAWNEVFDKIAFVVDCSDKFRAAYALIRGTFSLVVLSRLDNTVDNMFIEPPFDEYRTWIRMCLNSATLLAKVIERTNGDDDSLTKDNVLDFNEPFFRDEIAWLYNERALVSFVQGRLFDALPLYDQSIRVIGRKYSVEHAISSRSQYRRIRLNQALAQLERGHLGMAKSILESILRATEPRWISDTPSTIHIYAKGYMALCHHLSDDYTSASSMYIDVIDRLKEEGHIRGQSIFRRHYADLLRAMSKSREDRVFIEATDQLRTAEELAIGIRAVDLQNYTLIARARLERDKANRKEALESLRQAESYARRMGIYKMLAEVFKVRGEVLLAEGEATQAGYVTSQSIAIAKRHGMRLRKISAALIQADILKMRGQRKDAERLLNEVLQESLALGYTTKASVATKLLSELW